MLYQLYRKVLEGHRFDTMIHPFVHLSKSSKLLITMEMKIRSSLQVGSGDLAAYLKRSQAGSSKMRSVLISFNN